ncbi:MAG: hypothetical protein JKY54_06875 [Flavobacteriales bacterium]|nr:hypothetical protein [Flavobacteriales bacterium]
MKRLILISICILTGISSFAQKQFWGMTITKGSVAGTIFKTDSVGNNYSDVYVFNNSNDGIDPYGSLIQANDGNLYGLTKNGGSNNFGTIFKFDPSSLDYTKIHDFDSINGKNPFGSLLQASNGKLYGMTHSGGMHIEEYYLNLNFPPMFSQSKLISI